MYASILCAEEIARRDGKWRRKKTGQSGMTIQRFELTLSVVAAKLVSE